MEPNNSKSPLDEQTERELREQIRKELLQDFENEKGGVTSKKFNKTFTKIQAITILTLTLFFSTGGGYALGHFYFWNSLEAKRINEQLAFYEEKVKINPNSLEDRIILGYTHYLKGNNNSAIQEFKYVLDQDDKYYDAYYNLGLVYLDEKKHYEALSMFGKTVDIAPRDYKGHAQLGITYRHLNMLEEALNALNEANKLAPANSDIIYQIGLVAEAQGDLKTAVEIYKDALQYDPLYENAAVALDRIEKNELKNVGE
ncbi:tetratricopeptide repeat protein [Anaerobacillus isosaccharinicus]|uniref:Tetratricopeptide repeat protein n=1 Tax=Anaerobacillus isosaccharinicus TaxID=1532552 RepID=A0A7S7L876_9BACI|nr:CDC27 family protein [Anaerobacillus isosaccharinicus]MBA5585433.1 tetratricopeptide repeat protein [Anaerobacillus isosaccharinicus]QOY36249.1 tetratricopeptide repeat protein [Anaerobacillus isosaccharinicus]